MQYLNWLNRVITLYLILHAVSELDFPSQVLLNAKN